MGAPPISKWDPRMDLVRMLSSTGLGIIKISRRLSMSSQLVSKIKKQFPNPPPIEERMERCVTRKQAILTANLYILAQRIRGQTFPRNLTTWETPKLSGSRAVISARNRMIEDGVSLRAAEYYATAEIAPALLNVDFVHVPHRRYDDPRAWMTRRVLYLSENLDIELALPDSTSPGGLLSA